MINYILQVVLFQVLFLAIYDFFLSKETFFTKNRWYLLTTPILSFILPLIKIPTFQKAVSQEYIVQLPEIFLSPEKVIKRTIDETTFYESVNYINIIFWFGVAVFSVLFFVKLMKIINLIKTNKAEKLSIFRLIFIPNKTHAFSFFNYIFLGKEIPVSQQEKIIQHEMVHSEQKHSLDLLLFEFLKIAMWFNPMIYFYQKRITLLHEYISDDIVSKKEAKETYINNLLSNYFQVENVAFINQFYKKSLIKKRIIMMTKKQSKKMNQLKYLLLIPVLASMLFYTSCSEEGDKISTPTKQAQTMYFNKNGKVEKTIGKEETYLDVYLGIGKGYEIPKGKELTVDDLSEGEKNEYLEFKESAESGDKFVLNVRIFEYKKGRKVVVMLPFSEFIRDETAIETEEMSFLKIDKAPTFPGCESGDKDCFSKMIQKHFAKNFDANLPNTLGLSSGRKRIFISFKIDKEGNVADIQVRAPHEDIKQEVLSVMNSLPKVIPGEHEGKTVVVKYSIPFTIIVGEDHGVDNTTTYKSNSLNNSDGSLSFMKIDKTPTFPGCEAGDKDCFSKMVQKHFSRNFDSEMPKKLGLDSGRKQIFISFNIDKEGNVTNIKTRTPHNKITEEVKRVMSSLPKMKPGEDNGEKVNVNYSIPFAIVIE